MVGWADSVRTRRGEGGSRIGEWVASLRSFGREQAARRLGWGGVAVGERAKLLARMVTLIAHGLQTKTYEEFVAAFSNPGRPPDALKRLSRKANFQLRISPTCWYDAAVSYTDDAARTLSMVGGGDDLGVSITAGSTDNRILVDFITDYGDTPGRDALAMVRALSRLPGYRRASSGGALLEF
jgi:hypothetical protein